MITILVISLLVASVSAASSNIGCQFELTAGDGTTDVLGTVALLDPSTVTADSTLSCVCEASRNSVEIILPDGNVATNTSSLDVNGDDLQFFQISPTTGNTLPEGVYTCQVDGENAIYAYILDSNGLSRSFRTICSTASLSPTVELIFEAQLSGIAPTDVICEDNGTPVVANCQINVTNPTRPTETLLSIPFIPNADSGTFACRVDGAMGTLPLLSCSYQITRTSVNIPPAPETLQIGRGATVVEPFSQINIDNTEISQTNPLWCQGSNSSDMITWIVPSGERITADSSSGPYSVTTASGALGLYTMDTFPSGLYVCEVNEERVIAEVGTTSSLQSPMIVPDSQSCEFANNMLTISAQTSGGIPSTISCTPSATQTSIAPSTTSQQFDISATFNPITDEQTMYVCTIANSAGNAQIQCSISDMDTVSDLSAERDPTDPTVISISWQGSAPSYTVTISSDETVLQTLTSSTNNITVSGLDPDQEIVVMVSTDSPNSTPVSISVPAAPRRCQPTKAYTIELCLRQELMEGENVTVCDCNSTGFGQQAFDSFLMNSMCVNCTSSPMVMHNAEDCECEYNKENTKRGRGRGRGRGRSRPRGKRQRGSMSKSRGRSMSTGDGTIDQVCIEGTFLCPNCDTFVEMQEVTGRRGRGRGRMRSKSNSKNQLIDSECSTSNVISVLGNNYSIVDLDIKEPKGRSRNREQYFCGEMAVSNEDSCDCPATCPAPAV